MLLVRGAGRAAACSSASSATRSQASAHAQHRAKHRRSAQSFDKGPGSANASEQCHVAISAFAALIAAPCKRGASVRQVSPRLSLAAQYVPIFGSD